MSKLLMGALVVLSVGVFTSCKDYEDEINANSQAISNLQTQLDALKKAQEDCAAECQLRKAEAAAAKERADEAWTLADKAKNDAKAAQDSANKALAEAEVARQLAVAAQAAADEAAALAKAEAAAAKKEVLEKLEKDLGDLETRIAEKYETKADFEAAIAKYTTTEELNKLLSGVETKISDLRTDMENGDKDLKEKYEAVKKIADEIYADYITQGKLDAALAVLESKIMGAVDEKVSALNKIVKTNRDSIAINAAAIAVLQQTVLQIDVNKKAIAALSDRVKAIEDAPYATAADLETLKSTIVAMYTSAIANACDQLEQKLTNGILKTMNDAIKANAKGIQANKTSIDSLANAVNLANAALVQSIDSLGKVTKALEANKADKAAFDELKKLVEETYGPKINAMWTWYQSVKENVAKISNILADIETLKASKLDKSVFDAKVKELMDKDAALLDSISKHRGDINKLTDDLNAAVARIDAAEAAIKGIQSDINTMVLFLNKNLTSIVTKPSSWLYGLPRIDADVVEAQQTTKFDGFKKADAQGVVGIENLPVAGQEDGATWDRVVAANGYTDPFTQSGENNKVGQAVELTAYYWLNPSTTNWEEYTYTMDEVPTQSTITRGNNDYEKAEVTDVHATEYKGGVLTIKFKFKKGENVNDAKTQGRVAGEDRETFAWITAVALQAKRTNTADETKLGLEDNRVITSDYAIVAPNYITKLVLGNFKYSDAGHDGANAKDDEKGYIPEGNHCWHLHTNYPNIVDEDYAGIYGFELDFDSKDTIDLNKFIDTHYFTKNAEGADVESNKTWFRKDLQERDFDYKYTLLETDKNKGVWGQSTDDNQSKFYIKDGKPGNTGNDKAAIVRVELVSTNGDAKGKTFAYGYVSILMRNKPIEPPVKLDSLRLDCGDVKAVLDLETGNPINQFTGDVEFNTGLKYDDFIKLIEDSLGTEIDWELQEFAFAANPDRAKGTSRAEEGIALKKFKNANSDDEDTDHLGTIYVKTVKDKNGKEVKQFVWSFTHDEAIEAFYEEDGVTAKNIKDYSTWIKIIPNQLGQDQGVAQVNILITIPGVIFPQATFGFDQRILSYWFKNQSPDTAHVATDRHEVHGSVEVYGQKDANDEFIYDFSSTFRTNRFLATGLHDFSFLKNRINAYFDASMYWIVPEDFSGVITDYPATSTAIGASGAEYLLYLNNAHDLTLKAIKKIDGKFTYEKAQPVVTLSGDPYEDELGEHNIGNYIATYHEYTYFDGEEFDGNGKRIAGNAIDYEYAYDLLNSAKHSQLTPITAGRDKGKMAFTSHMILEIADYCLPVKLIGEGHKFDIRYLRPISIDNMGEYTVYDAEDGVYEKIPVIDEATGEIIGYEEEIMETEDNKTLIYLANIVKFIDWRDVHFAADKKGMKYVNYYGIRAINPNFERAECDLDGVRELISGLTAKLKFTKEHIGKSEPTLERTAKDFKEQIGYFLYENNSSVVNTFHIWLPLTIEYHWGETADEVVTITVVRTKSNARAK